jgi:hypothetical protein
MKKYSLIFLCFGLFSGMIFAHGSPSITPLKNPIVAKYSQGSVIVKLIPGSLKANIENIAQKNGWHKVIWNAHNDYNWVAYTQIEKPSLVAVMETLLEGYPLRAIFYQGNRVLVIETRTVR